MQLKYELIENHFEEVTQMTTRTEQARLPDGSWLIRTVMYTPYLITADVSCVPAAGTSKKNRKKRKKKVNGDTSGELSSIPSVDSESGRCQLNAAGALFTGRLRAITGPIDPQLVTHTGIDRIDQ